MVLGFRIRRLRKEKMLSQDQLGKLLGVSKVSVSGYENGTRNPSMEILSKMVDIFNVSADYILGKEVNAICEDGNNFLLSSQDIVIINEIRKNSSLYQKILEDPKRFFSAIWKKSI